MSPKLLPVALALLMAPAALAQDGPGRRPPQGPDPLVARLDADGNGALSADEIAAAATVLARLDRDGDGALSARELAALAPRGGRPRQGATSSPEAPPLAADDGERRAMAVLAELDQNRRGNMNVPENDGRLLRMLVESSGAKKIAELGTSNGYSSIWMALGVRATGGHVTTHEIDPRRAEIAKGNMERAGVADRITIVLGDAHETVKALEGPLDLVFIDADKDGYLDYLEKLFPKVRPGGLIVSHNMNRPQPAASYIEAITADPRLDTLFFHMDDSGIAVSLKKHAPEGVR